MSFKKIKNKILPFVMALILTIGIMPSSVLPAFALEADSLRDLYHRTHDLGEEVEVDITLQDQPSSDIWSTKHPQGSGQGLGALIGEYEYNGGTGLAYCNDHSRNMHKHGTVKVNSSDLVTDKLLGQVYYLGFTDSSRDANYAKQSIAELASHFPGISGDWVNGLTDDEWRKATQYAIWMAGHGLYIEGMQKWENGPVDIPYDSSYKDRVYNKSNPSAAQQRVLNAAKALYAAASYGVAMGDCVIDRKVGATSYNTDYDTPLSQFGGDTVYDFTSAGGGNNGTMDSAFQALGNGSQGGIYRQTVNGQDCYIMYYAFVSATQSDGGAEFTVEGNLPSGTFLSDIEQQDLVNLSEYGDIAAGTPTYGTTIKVWAKNSDEVGFGASLPDGSNPNGFAFVRFLKLCVPVSSASVENAEINIKSSTEAKAYYVFSASNTDPSLQPFLMGDTIADVNWTQTVRWGSNPDQITAYKVNSATGARLAGFEFTATCVENPDWTITAVSDSDGVLRFNIPSDKTTYNGSPTHWKITESKVRPGYSKCPDEWTVEAGSSETFTFKNEPPEPVNGVIKKIDAQTKLPVQDATFRLSSTETGVTTERVSGANGEVPVQWWDPAGDNYIPPGTYLVEEITPAPGYLLPEVEENKQLITFTYDEETGEVSSTGPIIFEDYYQTEIIIEKINDSGEPLEGAQFELYIDGKLVKTGPTNEDGQWVLSMDEISEFNDTSKDSWSLKVVEKAPPDGYLLPDPNFKELEVAKGDALVPIQFSFTDADYPQIEIQKIDAVTGEPVPGAVFHIEIDGAVVMDQAVTGEDGKITLNYEDYGRFLGDSPDGELQAGHQWTVTVTEVGAPDGYNLDQQEDGSYTLSQRLTLGQTLSPFVFEDTPYKEIRVQKLDKETHQPVAGATFELHSLDGNISDQVATSGPDGWAVFENVPNGSYVITETAPPEGYERASGWQKEVVVTSESKDLTFTCENRKLVDIQVKKIDSKTGAALAGAQFKLKSLDNTIEERYATSGADGIATFEDVPNGVYEVTEVAPPPGYENAFEWSETVKIEDGTASVVVLTCKDKQLSDLEILKVDSDTHQPLEGARFRLESQENPDLNRELTTGADGKVTFEDLPCGVYDVYELYPPEGYENRELWHQQVIITPDSEVLLQYTCENHPLTDIRIIKYDSETYERLDGAEFKLHDLNSNIDDRIASQSENGEYWFENVPKGTYELSEVHPPEGYEDAFHWKQTVVIKDGTETLLEYECFNKPLTDIEIVKEDEITHAKLKGAEFTLSDVNHNIDDRVLETNEEGKVLFEDLPVGVYEIKETHPPFGFENNKDWKITVNIQPETKSFLTYTCTDLPMTGLTIAKVDGDTGAFLPGAEFEVDNTNGEFVTQVTTDASGLAYAGPLPEGDYVVKETKTPMGDYILDPTDHLVHVKAADPTVLTIENFTTTLIIRKLDAAHNGPIAGAVFKVETADHSLVGTFETDGNGEALVTHILPGTYIVTEQEAPTGYQMDPNPQKTVVVEAGKENYVEFYDMINSSLIVILQDKISGENLAGGEFTVTRASDNMEIYNGETDVTGSFQVGDLVPGKYVITQKFAPEGYYLTDYVIDVDIPSGTQQTVHFYNITSGLVIEKVDSVTGETLEGARFQVTRDEDAFVVGEFVTDKDGLALVSGLKPGLYTVEELVPPTGYAMDEGPKTVHTKETGEAHVTFADTPLSGITVHVVDKDTRDPLAGAVVEVWQQNGDLVNTYTTDSTGTFMTDTLPAGFYVLKLIHLEDNYTCEEPEAVVEVVNGQSVTYTFECVASGSLNIFSVDQDDKAIGGMKVKVTTIDGTYIGEYTTDEHGTVVVPGLAEGYYVITEIEPPDGYTIVTESQTVHVESNGAVKVVFEHNKIFGLQIRTVVAQTKAPLAGAVYEVTKPDGAKIGTFTSDGSGLVYVTLEPGYYIVKPVSVPDGYTMTDSAARTLEVKANIITETEFVVNQLSSIDLKVVDGTTNQGIYGVRILLKNGSESVKEYTTNNEGKITLSKDVLNGNYTMEMISVPSGYTVDPVPKSIAVPNGETTEIVWKLYKEAGQIQVVLTSADYNKSRALPEGSLLQGAVFEIMNADTYEVMGQMITDAYGVAASPGLPIGRYMVRQLSAPPYYAVSSKQTEVRLKVNNDVVRIEYTNASVNMGVEVNHQTNKSVTAGLTMRVDVTAAANKSDTNLDNFFMHIKVPTDGARITTLATGIWNSEVFYNIYYKTNMNDYRLLVEHISSATKYEYDLSTQSLNLQLGEYTTDVRFEFGTVPAGFCTIAKPQYMLYTLSTVTNNYKLISRIEIGGQYNAVSLSTNGNVGSNGVNFSGADIAGNSGVWTADASLWTTTVEGGSGSMAGSYPNPGGNGLVDGKPSTLPDHLPKTGY